MAGVFGKLMRKDSTPTKDTVGQRAVSSRDTSGTDQFVHPSVPRPSRYGPQAYGLNTGVGAPPGMPAGAAGPFAPQSYLYGGESTKSAFFAAEEQGHGPSAPLAPTLNLGQDGWDSEPPATAKIDYAQPQVCGRWVRATSWLQIYLCLPLLTHVLLPSSQVLKN